MDPSCAPTSVRVSGNIGFVKQKQARLDARKERDNQENALAQVRAPELRRTD